MLRSHPDCAAPETVRAGLRRQLATLGERSSRSELLQDRVQAVFLADCMPAQPAGR